ncbi:MAG TPA: class F sortase [Jatrophihabitantaceae bacterium]|nr:class F sortase [Jatrophihabitantaceae bacterium]
MSPFRQLALGAAWLVFIVGTCTALNATAGKTSEAAPLAGGALPPEVVDSASSPFTESDSPSTTVITKTVTPPPSVLPARPGVPVSIDIPFPSSNYPDGMRANVTSNPLNGNGSLFVPDDPKTVSWANQDAAPGSDHGTIILTSHINFVIDGSLVHGAFADLAEYARTSVGKVLTLGLADGRHLKYKVVAGREYSKEELAADPNLRVDLFNQTGRYGAPGKPKTSRLLLVSCGGAFDNATGEYEDNVFLYALPVAAT